jgi:ribulose-phosphate 3-epimerase
MPQHRPTIIAPSVLAADFARLGDELEKVEKGGAEWLHLDVMDGHFVPNISFGPFIVKAIRGLSKLKLDTHLMISDPAGYAESFAEAGCDLITFHYEAVDDPRATLGRIIETGVQVGISIKPATAPEVLYPLLSDLDLVLVMSVEPGFGGQKFIPESVAKIRALRDEIDRQGTKTLIQVDGGINPETSRLVINAGVDAIVAGTAVFRADDPAQAIAALRR